MTDGGSNSMSWVLPLDGNNHVRMPKITEIVAWWGAVLSTTVFLWDIYKWRTAGPKIRMTVQTDMEAINMTEHQGKTLLRIDVINYGDRPTTITNVIFACYSSAWAQIRKNASKVFVIPRPSTAQPLPFELKPGCVWTGIGIQDEKLEQAARSSRLFCFVCHSHRNRPLKQRVAIKERPNTAVNKEARSADSARSPLTG
jgi:hypothetical protein